MKAINLEQVLRFFDPTKALTGQALNDWFVSRKRSPRQRLKISLTHQFNEPQKVLLVGHRGSGKSTELNKLAEEIKDRFHVVGFNVLDITGRTNLAYENLMLAISTQVTRDCIEHNMLNRPVAEPVRNGLQELGDWWRRVVAGLDFQPPPEGEASIQLSTLLGQVELGAKQSSLTREALREQVNRQMPELIRRLNWVIEQAEAVSQRRPLIIVEGLDKVDLEAATSIFRDHAPTITAPNAAMIYTFPIALRHSDHWNTIRLSFPNGSFLPNVTTRNADGTDNEYGLKTMRRLVLARAEERLIEREALDLIVRANGGIASRLVFLVRTAALYALERDERADRITVTDASNAIKELRREIMVTLTRNDLQVLRKRHRDRQLTNDEDEQRLLYNGSLIDYSNGEPWCDAHPVLWALLEHEDDSASTEPLR